VKVKEFAKERSDTFDKGVLQGCDKVRDRGCMCERRGDTRKV
jgi:hypothetical protein